MVENSTKTLFTELGVRYQRGKSDLKTALCW